MANADAAGGPVERRAHQGTIQLALSIAIISLILAFASGIVAYTSFRKAVNDATHLAQSNHNALIATQTQRTHSRFDTCEAIRGGLYAATSDPARLSGYLQRSSLANCRAYARQDDLTIPK